VKAKLQSQAADVDPSGRVAHTICGAVREQIATVATQERDSLAMT